MVLLFQPQPTGTVEQVCNNRPTRAPLRHSAGEQGREHAGGRGHSKEQRAGAAGGSRRRQAGEARQARATTADSRQPAVNPNACWLAEHCHFITTHLLHSQLLPISPNQFRRV